MWIRGLVARRPSRGAELDTFESDPMLADVASVWSDGVSGSEEVTGRPLGTGPGGPAAAAKTTAGSGTHSSLVVPVVPARAEPGPGRPRRPVP